MPLSKNAITVLEKRYLLKDDQGQLCETPEGLFTRMARALAEQDRTYGASDAEVEASFKRFFDLTYSLDFLPNSPTIANAGTRTGQLSACFVLPVPDDLSGIFEALKHQALIHQTGGGTGFDFSRLRPAGDRVGSTKGESSGPVTFMDVFNAATESIKQGGMRRGANMGMLRIDHPDIEKFIGHKEDLSKLTNFNISVSITNAFMKSVEDGTPFGLVNPRTGEVTKTIDARKTFKEIAERAWRTGEPGVIFIDRMNEYCPVPWIGQYEATNPCGEQALLPYESCNLGSLNLENFVVAEDGNARIDWDRLRQAVRTATHLLENVITANKFPIPELKEMSDKTRKLGLGMMGYARMLYKLGVAYGSEEALAIAAQVMSFMDFWSKVESVELAKVRGSFPGRVGHEEASNRYFEKVCTGRHAQPEKHADCDYLWLYEQIKAHGIRNSNTTTVAPTGTISMIADTSGGCEPAFALSFKRFQADTHMFDADKVFRAALEAKGLGEETIQHVFEVVDKSHGSLRLFLEDADGLAEARRDWLTDEVQAQLEELASVYNVAHDVTPSEHVYTQAAFQLFNDSSISKTINFPEWASVEDVEEAYLLAWKLNCKGITVYRNNSRSFQPLSVSKKEAAKAEAPAPVAAPAGELKPRVRPRPEDLYGYTRTSQTGDGKLYTTVNYDEFGIREVVTNIGRSGGTLFSLSEAIGRLISLALQYNVPVDEISRSLIGIRGANPYGFGQNQVLSIPDAIGKVLKDSPRQLGSVLAAQPATMPVVEPVAVKKGSDRFGPDAVRVYGESPECPECGHGLDFGEGCMTCRSCGYSKCS